MFRNCIMRPLVWHNYLCWFILLGHLGTLAFTFSSGKLVGEAIVPVSWMHNPKSDVLGDTDSCINNYVDASVFFSPPNYSVSCEDLKGVGSFNTTCLLNSNLHLSTDVYIYGMGNLEILPYVSIECPVEGCMLIFNLSGNVNVGKYATIAASSVVLSAANLMMESYSSINTTSLGGSPPPQTSGTPVGYEGAGGGHGGRGASCLKNNKTSNWGGDVYSWSTLSDPWSYGSKGGGTSASDRSGGNGGGRVKIIVKDMLYLNGSVLAEGGDGGHKGGGGSGGSIFIYAVNL